MFVLFNPVARQYAGETAPVHVSRLATKFANRHEAFQFLKDNMPYAERFAYVIRGLSV